MKRKSWNRLIIYSFLVILVAGGFLYLEFMKTQAPIGTDPAQVDPIKMTPTDLSLHEAVKKGQKHLVEDYLNQGADPNIQNDFGDTPLHLAYDLSIAKILLNHKAKINTKNKWGFAPLHSASQNDNGMIVDLLIEKGAPVNNRATFGNTPLHLAALEGHKTVADKLLMHGAAINETNEDGYTPLHWAAEQGHEGMVKWLLDKGADINFQNIDGMTPLHFAVEGGHNEITQILHDYGAKIGFTTQKGHTALHLIARKGKKGQIIQLVNLWSQPQAYVDIKDKIGRTALHLAAASKHKEAVDSLFFIFFIVAGADVNVTDNNGLTPLHLAQLNHNDFMVSELKSNGAVETPLPPLPAQTEIKKEVRIPENHPCEKEGWHFEGGNKASIYWTWKVKDGLSNIQQDDQCLWGEHSGVDYTWTHSFALEDINYLKNKETGYIEVLRQEVRGLKNLYEHYYTDTTLIMRTSIAMAAEVTGLPYQKPAQWVTWWEQNKDYLVLSEDGTRLLVRGK